MQVSRFADNLDTEEPCHSKPVAPEAPAVGHDRPIHTEDIENEARWLAGALLVTADAARCGCPRRCHGAGGGTSPRVSEQMVTYRLNVTGTRKRVARSRHLCIAR